MKILVIRFKQIGDALVTLPLISNLKRAFPDACIDYVLYSHIAPLFEKHPDINRVISISPAEQKNILHLFLKARKICSNEYDVIIDVMSTTQSQVFTLNSLRSKYRIGRYKKGKGITYNHKIKEPEENSGKVKKLLLLADPLCQDFSQCREQFVTPLTDYKIHLDEKEIADFRQRMASAGVRFAKPVIAFAINSRRDYKVWPQQYMKTFIEHCLNNYDVQILFFYSPDEKAYALDMHEQLNNHPAVFSNIETKSVRELALLIANCDFFTGNEGGPRHIAQATGVPSFVICSPSAAKSEWLPQNDPQHTGIEPQDVGGEDYQDMNPGIVTDKFDKMFRNLLADKL